MAGVEVLGALAAASQLAEQALKITISISNLYAKIHDAPESIRRQSVQVEQLIDIARLIQHNPPLQTALVEPILRNCVDEAGKLQEILKKISTAAGDGRVRKVWKALDGVTKEKRILAFFANLEREKSSLALCIETIDSTLLHTIYNALPTISRKVTAIHDAMQHLTLNQPISVPMPKSNVVEGLFIVPYARNPYFIGRGTYIESLGTKLEPENRHNRVALVGLGGVGKSQVALEYAYRRYEKSAGISIFWVHASNASRFEQDYLQIGINAKLPGVNDPGQEIKQLVKNWLSSKESGTWLMIIDNADDIDMFFGARNTSGSSLDSKRLSRFLPQCSNGSIMFTTRNKKAGVKFATAGGVIHLQKMDPVDAEELFKAHLGEDLPDQDGMTELLELLEYLPLAISQAGSYITENSTSIFKYLQMYNESEASAIALLNENFEDLARDPETANPVAATWAISFEQIRKLNILAANLLSFMACLDRQGIPIALLPSTECSVRLSSALGLLKAYSLITASRNDLVFDMHRLVYLATRNWLRLNNAFEDWAELCLTQVSKKFPSGEHGTLDTCDLYLPHAQAVLGMSGYRQQMTSFRAQLAHKVSYYLCNRGFFYAAEPFAEQAVRWKETVLGPEHPSTLASVSYLALVQRGQGKYQIAEAISRRALEGMEKALGPEHPDTLASVTQLALVLQTQGKHEAAEAMNRRALEGCEKGLEPEHPDLLTCISNLAEVLQEQGKYEVAEAMNRRVLEGSEKVLGPEHPDTLTSVSQLASVLRYQGKYEAAEAMNQRALEGREKALGPEHPRTLASVSDLALVLLCRGKYEAAEAMNRRALEESEKVLGPEHPWTLTTVDNLAVVLLHQGKYEAAEAMNRRALEGYKKALGPEHPDTLTSIGNLASVLRDQGKYEMAEEMYQQVLDGREKVLGPEHPETLTSIGNLALVLRDQGKYEMAEEMHQQVLDGREKVLGPEHPDTLTSVSCLAGVLRNRGKYEVAEAMNRRALEGYEKALGLEHPDTLTSIGNLALVLRDQGKYEVAEEMQQRVLEWREKVLGREHLDTLTSVSNLALVLQDQGKYETAEAMNRRALEEYEKALGPEHPRTLMSMHNLAVVLRQQGKYEVAEMMSRRALDGERKVLGENHPCWLKCVDSLAVVLRWQGKYEAADDLHRRALDGYEKVLGWEHPWTLMSADNLAVVLRDQGKYGMAEEMHRRALDRREKVLGLGHPDTLTSVDNLALVLRAQGKYEMAEEIHQRVVEGKEKAIGPDHLDIKASTM